MSRELLRSDTTEAVDVRRSTLQRENGEVLGVE